MDLREQTHQEMEKGTRPLNNGMNEIASQFTTWFNKQVIDKITHVING